MTHGIDTGFLVELEIVEHADHSSARTLLDRLLDTQLVATYRQANIPSILTTNPGDFGIFGEFVCRTPADGVAPP